jgi:hypothetical protein
VTLSVLLGQQTPRLQLVPPCVSSAAQDAVDIYQSTGQLLDPWQELCLQVGCGERADTSWAAFEVGVICQRQNGKGADIEAICLASLFVWGNLVTIYSAHRGDTARATFRRIRALIESTPDLSRRVHPISDSDEVITLVGGGRLEFRTRSGSGGRGLTGDLVILDEALELNAEQIAALVPIMLARPYAQMWYFSTVPASADQHLCAVRARVVAGGQRLAWAEWGNDSGVGLDDPGALAAANPALGIRITLERLQDLRGILGDEKFSTECLGIWPEMNVGTVLNPAIWRNMFDAFSHRADGADLVIAFDMTPMREFGSVGMFALRSDGLEHMQLVDYRPAVDWMVSRLAELNATLAPALFVVERKNGAYALLDDLAAVGIREAEKPQELNRGELLVLEAGEMSDAVGQFIDGYRRHPAPYRHIGQEPLKTAVDNARTRPIGDSGQIAWSRKLSGVDIGPIVVVTEAKYGHAAWLTRRAKVIPRSKVW